MFDMEIKGYEVHARRRNGKIVFRIWDGESNCYVTRDLVDGKRVAARLVELETSRFKEEMTKRAMKRVKNAQRDGFESPFVTSGELNDPWKEEGVTIERGI